MVRISPEHLTAIEKTDVSDAVAFYKAFAMTSVKMNTTDELDVNDPHTLTVIRERDMTLLGYHASIRPKMTWWHGSG